MSPACAHIQGMETRSRIGIDIGRVIVSAADAQGQADTSFLTGGMDEALRTPPTPGAFDAIRQLVEATEGAVWLVSKAGPRVQEKTRRWLDHLQFHELTGLPRENVRFCRERKEKAVHCVDLGITHFVDDRLDVLVYLRGFVPNLFLFGIQPPDLRAPDWVCPVLTWSDALAAITARWYARAPGRRAP